jgi:hypothetical protein
MEARINLLAFICGIPTGAILTMLILHSFGKI